MLTGKLTPNTKTEPEQISISFFTYFTVLPNFDDTFETVNYYVIPNLVYNMFYLNNNWQINFFNQILIFKLFQQQASKSKLTIKLPNKLSQICWLQDRGDTIFISSMSFGKALIVGYQSLTQNHVPLNTLFLNIFFKNTDYYNIVEIFLAPHHLAGSLVFWLILHPFSWNWWCCYTKLAIQEDSWSYFTLNRQALWRKHRFQFLPALWRPQDMCSMGMQKS